MRSKERHARVHVQHSVCMRERLWLGRQASKQAGTQAGGQWSACFFETDMPRICLVRWGSWCAVHEP